MIIGQSVYNVPTLTHLLETEIFSIVEYQVKRCSVANDAAAAPDYRMVWSEAACCRPGHQRVAWTAVPWCDDTFSPLIPTPQRGVSEVRAALVYDGRSFEVDSGTEN